MAVQSSDSIMHKQINIHILDKCINILDTCATRVLLVVVEVELFYTTDMLEHLTIRSSSRRFIHHSFIHSFNHSYVYSFVHSFINLFIRLFIYSFVYLFICSFVRFPFVHWFIGSWFSCSVVELTFVHLFIFSLIH